MNKTLYHDQLKNYLSHLVVLVGCLVIIGWIIDFPFLKQIHPSLVSMKFNTALCFVLLALGAVFAGSEFRNNKYKCLNKAALYLPVVVLVLAGLTLVEYLLSFNFFIDELFMSDNTKGIGTSHPGRMAPNTAFCFCLLAIAQLVANKNSRLYRATSLIALLISGFAILGYTSGVKGLYGLESFTQMAVHTSVCICLLSLATLLICPGKELVNVLSGSSQSSRILRQVVPLAILLPVFIGCLIHAGQRNMLLDSSHAFVLMVITCIAISSYIIYYQSSALLMMEYELVDYSNVLIELTEDLKRKNKDLEELTYIATHDLREPLRTIEGFSELLQDEANDKLDKDCKEYLEFIVSASGRMQNLIDGLLTYSRIGRVSKKDKVDCNELLEQVTQDLHSAINDANAKVKIEKLPVISGYEIELRLLFQNLISNAVKFRREKMPCEIEIRYEETHDSEKKYWLFEVKDNGIGINEKFMKRAFKMFQQLQDRSQYEGCGIGLAHCKRICELHNGDIWFTSLAGQGTSFFIKIPVS